MNFTVEMVCRYSGDRNLPESKKKTHYGRNRSEE
jgi:hypothetical protein